MKLKIILLTIVTTIVTLSSHAQEIEQQEFPTLSAYQDFLDQTSEFSFSFLRYRPRGYDNRLTPLSWNGTPLTNWQNGTNSWNLLGNLSTLAQNQPQTNALTTTFDLWQAGGRVSTATSNRSYLYRAGARYIYKGGWNLAADLSRRGGESLSIEGVSTDDYSIFLALGRDFGNHNITLSLLYAPSLRSTQRATTQEAYQLTGNNLYNSAWGYQNGRKRSARQSRSHQPVAMLEHKVRLTDQIELYSTLSARLGEQSYTTLMWQNAPNPYPDYYRYLPSFQKDSTEREILTRLWQQKPEIQQINYQNLYNINGYNTPLASYIFENRVSRSQYYRVASQISSKYLSGGVEAAYALNRNFKTIDDLMGSQYWLDIDAYVEQDDDVKDQVQSNLRNPNFKAKQGDVFGYDYQMSMVSLGAWIQAQRSFGPYGVSAKLEAGSKEFQRQGFFEKENFNGNRSYGYSPTVIGYEYAVDLSGWYALGGRFRAQLNIGYRSMTPTPTNIFISPEYRNTTIDNVVNSKILTIEATADYRIGTTKIRGALYHTTIRDNSRLMSFYDDNLHAYTNYWMQGINERYMGLEFAAEFQVYYNLKLSTALRLSDNRYTSNPTATQWKESTGQLLRQDEMVYYENLHTASSPQCVGVISLRYAPRGYSVELSANVFDNNYIAPSPLRRTARGQVAEILPTQEKLSAGMTLDLQLGKSFTFGRNEFVGIYLGVNNLLNNCSIRSSGYESYRTSTNGSAASKYYYALGVNGYLSVVYRF